MFERVFRGFWKREKREKETYRLPSWLEHSCNNVVSSSNHSCLVINWTSPSYIFTRADGLSCSFTEGLLGLLWLFGWRPMVGEEDDDDDGEDEELETPGWGSLFPEAAEMGRAGWLWPKPNSFVLYSRHTTAAVPVLSYIYTYVKY